MAVPTDRLLGGLHVLITRPQQQAGAWQSMLAAAGADTTCISLMTIEPVSSAADNQQIKQRILDLDLYQHVIFVSQNAVSYGCEWIDRYWPQLPTGIHFYAVGSATAIALQQRDYPVIAAGDSMNSEALLELPELQQIGGDRVLICRGQGGRPVLGEQLTRRGARVDYCELYRREFPQEALQQLTAVGPTAPFNAVAIHSGETLQNWHNAIQQLNVQHWHQIPVLVPGKRVQTLAADLGFTRVIMADNASNQTMLNALINWQPSENA